MCKHSSCYCGVSLKFQFRVKRNQLAFLPNAVTWKFLYPSIKQKNYIENTLVALFVWVL